MLNQDIKLVWRPISIQQSGENHIVKMLKKLNIVSNLNRKSQCEATWPFDFPVGKMQNRLETGWKSYLVTAP